jgi:hypothetical protein
MPRKKMPGRKVIKRVPRKEPYTADRLRNVAERLKEQSMRVLGLARGMDDSNVKGIQVDGHAMLVRGLNQIDNFTDNCARAVRETKSAQTTM